MSFQVSAATNTITARSVRILPTGNLKVNNITTRKEKTKDVFSDDKVVLAAKARLAVLDKEAASLRNKITKRVQSGLLKLALEVVSEQKWKIYNVDMYSQNEGYFQLSFQAVYNDSEISKTGYLVTKRAARLKPHYSGAAKYGLDAPDKLSKLKPNKISTLPDLAMAMEYYGTAQFLIDDCSLSISYDSFSIMASGKNSRDLVFALARKLKLKIDYATYIQVTDFAEAEIALRKRLIDDLSAEVLFGI